MDFSLACGFSSARSVIRQNVIISLGVILFLIVSRKESLVPGNDHIWKSEQPRERVVAQNQPRAIFEEDLFFPFVHIEAEVSEFEKGLRHRLGGGCRSYAGVIARMRIR
jgi:hypothetical protein